MGLQPPHVHDAHRDVHGNAPAYPHRTRAPPPLSLLVIADEGRIRILRGTCIAIFLDPRDLHRDLIPAHREWSNRARQSDIPPPEKPIERPKVIADSPPRSQPGQPTRICPHTRHSHYYRKNHVTSVGAGGAPGALHFALRAPAPRHHPPSIGDTNSGETCASAHRRTDYLHRERDRLNATAEKLRTSVLSVAEALISGQ